MSIPRLTQILEKVYDSLTNKMKVSAELTGSYVCLSTEIKPTEADGVKDGDDLLEINTTDKTLNKVYIYRTGAWREI